MIDFLKRLFGNSSPPNPPDDARATTGRHTKPAKPPIPGGELEALKIWFLQQTRPAVALTPDPSGSIGITGSRLGGPAWLAEGESWPTDASGVPLEFIAQLDCADCRSLADYPEGGIIQFFIGRDDLYGANFDDPVKSAVLVRRYDANQLGVLTAPPPLEIVADEPCSDFSPFQDDARRAVGIALRGEPVMDRMDQSIMEAEQRIYALYKSYDVHELDAFLESDEVMRPLRHHTGGYAAYTQSDVHHQPAFADHDHVLLRLTSDDIVMWGDVGECVFLIRSDDLKRADFTRVAYSWDCH